MMSYSGNFYGQDYASYISEKRQQMAFSQWRGEELLKFPQQR